MIYGTNSESMKLNNKKLVLNLIRQGSYSRADLSKKLKLTKPTLSILAEEMKREGLIYEECAAQYSGVGRPPVHLKINDKAKYVIGLSLGRNGYETGIFDLGGNAIASQKHSYIEGDASKNIEKMSEIINDYAKNVQKEKIIGIGVAAPGPLDYKSGKILNPPNFPLWHDFEIEKQLEKLCNLPVKLENVANAMAMAEQFFGCCKKEENFACVVVNDGIGAGIVVNGMIYRGHRGHGNELGHISICHDGLKCSCGNTGCLERYASVPSILENTKYETWKDVCTYKDYKIIDKEARYLSCGIISLLNLFDLGTIVLGGDIATEKSDISKRISDIVNEKTIVRHKVDIISSLIGENQALAASAIALGNFFY